MERKILLALDDSPRSSHSLQYICSLFADVPDIYFHLFSSAACQALPIGKEWLTAEELNEALPPAEKKRLQAFNSHLQEAARILSKHGIARERITTEVEFSDAGVARDIIHNACKGYYDAMLICRRGIGKIEELITGSVSSKVLDKCHTVPIWILDGSVTSTKILLAVDGSTYSLRAADHLAFIMRNNPHAEITLLHCPSLFPQKKNADLEEFYPEWGKKWCDRFLTGEDSLFTGPEQLLYENGIPRNHLKRLFVESIDPSRQIIRQALLSDYGTIVIGRRDRSAKKGLFGGVSDRVLTMAKDVAVWIVG